MPFPRLAAALPFALSLAACATPAQQAESSGPSDDSVAITVAQGPCFGTCPVYEARLTDKGELTFDGKRFTAQGGVQAAVRPPESFTALRQYLAPYRPAVGTTVRTREGAGCAPMVTDMVAITVTWEGVDGRRTVLDHYTGCRSAEATATSEALRQVPEWMGITEWVKRPE
ncbi:DUF6438 domain-containing protein [Sphingomonas sp. ID0503]|uniref:DUF6438 domain-containing protein n=1 Tax=Sphingomonas sp. ID0503 TaxID=3399691 RepID=UPI003AFADDA2